MFKWIKKFITTDKVANKSESLLIDVSDEIKPIIKNLIINYQNYCNYNEILNINENDRLPIMKYIWIKWNVHSSSLEKNLIFQYPQYNCNDLKLICLKEHKRIITLYKQQTEIERWEQRGQEGFLKYNMPFSPFIIFLSDKEKNNPANTKNLCLIYDMHKIANVWYTDDGHIDKYTFLVFLEKITAKSLNKYKFWVDGEIKNLNEIEFEKWISKYNIKYPLK